MLHVRARICVFAGSRTGARPVHAACARSLGCALARRNIGLVYGGSSRGLMGILAAAVREGGAEVIGVMPKALMVREAAIDEHRHELRIVDSMHERKAVMSDLADAFIALPGGFGTLDELFEIVTWAQIGLHAKPIGLLNTDGYFNPLLKLVEQMIAEGFVTPEDGGLLVAHAQPEELLDALPRTVCEEVARVPAECLGERADPISRAGGRALAEPRA
ncbi:MAG: TIGR00730 family Rossman fold protein [Chloroflexi bacterium]|nr:TIGR00730 family Rossman fold protein [Chloroflexota bacterium]